ncbi:MAG: AsmA family protein, partial [Kiritimatiellia bacterium]
MKKLLKILGVLLAIIVIALVVLEFSLDRVLHQGFNSFAPKALGVDATLADAKLSLIRGKASLEGLHIGNPPGFNTSGLLDLGKVSVKLDNASLLTDTIVIHEILVDGLVVTYEKGLRDSNLGALIESLTPAEAPDQDKEEAKKEKSADKSEKKVVIEKLSITDSKMNVSMTGLSAVTGGGSVPLPLPPITLTDLGKEKEGVTVVEAIQRI